MMEQFITKPDVTIYHGIKVNKDTKLEYKNEKLKIKIKEDKKEINDLKEEIVGLKEKREED